MIMDFLKRLGGAATGKVEKMLLSYVPYDFAIGRMSAKNVLASIVTYALADMFLEYRMPAVADMLKTGAAVMMADEIEKQVTGMMGGATQAAPRSVPVKAVAPATRGGIIIT